MPKTTVPTLSKDLLWYTAAAGAVLGLGATGADAQVVFVDIDPDLVAEDTFVGGGTLEGVGFDLVADGDDEIFFAEQQAGAYTIAGLDATADGPDTVTAIVGNLFPYGGNNYAYFLKLDSGDMIGASNATITGYGQATFNFGGSDPNGWIGTGDGYIGIQFSNDGTSTHYGWIRVEIPAGGGSIIVKDAAFESQPDTPIMAGDMGTVAIEPGPDGTPGTHNLSPVYPNPFNPQATFSLEIAEPQEVQIEVYNALGQRVAVLHDGALSAGSIHSFEIDGSALTSGVYLVRATGQQFVDTRQVTLLK